MTTAGSHAPRPHSPATTPACRDRAMRRVNVATGVATAATIAMAGAATGLAARATAAKPKLPPTVALQTAPELLAGPTPRQPAAAVPTPRPTRTVVAAIPDAVTRSAAAPQATRVGGGRISPPRKPAPQTSTRTPTAAPRPTAKPRPTVKRPTMTQRPVVPRPVVPTAPSAGS